MTLEQSLRGAVEKQPKLKRRAKRLLEVFDWQPSRRRDRVLARIHRHAEIWVRDRLDLDGNAAIDWDQIEWEKILTEFLEFMLAILPLILKVVI